MRAPSIAIPYEKQSEPSIHRGCGAACLSMVYKSFGMDVPQAEIWPLIAKQNRFGSVASTTHLMALHAANKGLSAVVIQARHPLQVLRLCREGGIRAILNHRPRPEASTGHYSVLVDIDERYVVLHDPAVGPSCRISNVELLQLWQPQSSASEIAGNVVIGIADEPVAIPACEFCHTAIPSKVDCPRCKSAVGLRPAALLGCTRDGCIARMWNYVACPSCDFMWSFNEVGLATADFPAPAAAARPSLVQPVNLDNVFAAMDQLSALILNIPGAADHADLNAQLNVLTTSRERMKLAQAEEQAALQAHAGKMAAFARESKQKQETQRKEIEERNAPGPPLDGNALGQALLKNLGFK